MKTRLLLILAMLTIAFSSCKKELIEEGNGRVYLERYSSTSLPIEGPQYVAFFKNNNVKVYLANGGPAATGKYKIFGSFQSKGSLITIHLDGVKEDIRYVVITKEEIGREGSTLILSEVNNH